jgi:hypothetical protein
MALIRLNKEQRLQCKQSCSTYDEEDVVFSGLPHDVDGAVDERGEAGGTAQGDACQNITAHCKIL